MIEDALRVMHGVAHATLSRAAAAGVSDLLVEVEPAPDVDVPEALGRISRTALRAEVDRAVAENFMVPNGPPASRRRGRYEPDVPLLERAEIRDLLRVPEGPDERPCVRGEGCISWRVKGHDGASVLRELPGRDGAQAMCILCHDELVARYVFQQTIDDPKMRFKPDPAESGATQVAGYAMVVNRVQYRFGEGGFRTDILATGTEFAPVPGVCGLVPTFSLEYFQWYTDDDGVARVNDENRYFRTASALL